MSSERLPTPAPMVPCRECRGRGSILLLVSTVPCKACAGKGLVPGPGSPLDIKVADLDLSVRARKGLQRLNAATLRDVVKLSEQDLRALKNLGETSIAEIKQQLARFGLALRKG